MPRSKKPTRRDSDSVDDELDHMLGTQDMKSRLNKLKGSPEKRSRSVSPTPSTSSALDIKPEKSKKLHNSIRKDSVYLFVL